MDASEWVAIIGAVFAGVAYCIREWRTGVKLADLKQVSDDTHGIVNSQRAHLLALNALYRRAFEDHGIPIPPGDIEQAPGSGAR